MEHFMAANPETPYDSDISGEGLSASDLLVWGDGAGDAAGKNDSDSVGYDSDFDESEESDSDEPEGYESDEPVEEEDAPEDESGEDFQSEDSAPEKISMTKAFSERLNKSVDAEIAGLGFVNPFTGKLITGKKELLEYKRQMAEGTASAAPEEEGDQLQDDAERFYATPGLLDRLTELRNKVASYETQIENAKQDRILSDDPVLGDIYRAGKPQIQSYADRFGLEPEAALMMYLRNSLGDITGKAKQQAQNEALTRSMSLSAASPGSLSGGGEPPVSDYTHMAPADFAELVRQAERGQLKKS